MANPAQTEYDLAKQSRNHIQRHLESSKLAAENSDEYKDLTADQLRTLLIESENKCLAWQCYMTALTPGGSEYTSPERVYDYFFVIKDRLIMLRRATSTVLRKTKMIA